MAREAPERVLVDEAQQVHPIRHSYAKSVRLDFRVPPTLAEDPQA